MDYQHGQATSSQKFIRYKLQLCRVVTSMKYCEVRSQLTLTIVHVHPHCTQVALYMRRELSRTTRSQKLVSLAVHTNKDIELFMVNTKNTMQCQCTSLSQRQFVHSSHSRWTNSQKSPTWRHRLFHWKPEYWVQSCFIIWLIGTNCAQDWFILAPPFTKHS